MFIPRSCIGTKWQSVAAVAHKRRACREVADRNGRSVEHIHLVTGLDLAQGRHKTKCRGALNRHLIGSAHHSDVGSRKGYIACDVVTILIGVAVGHRDDVGLVGLHLYGTSERGAVGTAQPEGAIALRVRGSVHIVRYFCTTERCQLALG